jgi:LmbE family N-acetylglucosaminyl deacetylase
MNNIIAIGAHPDDVEVTCGAFVKKLTEAYDVYYIVATTTQEQPTNKNIVGELNCCAKRMRVKDLKILDFPNSKLPNYSSEIREILYDLNKKLMPKLVICPSTGEIHQDHKTLSDEAIRVFRTTSIIGWIFEWSNFMVTPNFFFPLTKKQFIEKIRLVEMYKSQKNRSYTKLFISSMEVNGARLGIKWAEGLEMIRWVQRD